jgi:hypothetical protein
VSAQPGFYYRGVYQPLLLSWVGGTARCQYLDMTDRLEPPPLQVSTGPLSSPGWGGHGTLPVPGHDG